MLDRKVIETLVKILEELVLTQEKIDKLREEREFSLYSENMHRKFDLMNQYYELSTPNEFAFDKMRVLYNKHEIIKELKNLLQLRDIE